MPIMFGGIQIGVLTACVVLFVPMGMAGYHLSRNKMFFFSGALFITLVVGVHLTPYFPSVSDFDFVTSVQSVVVFYNCEDSCINLVNEVIWNVKPRIINSNGSDSSNDSVGHDKIWDWSKNGKVKGCDFEKLGRGDVNVKDLLNGSWVVVARDSQAQLLVQSLLSLILDEKKME